MLKVGLTGSIAVGKSTVSLILREAGFHLLDADRSAREAVAKGTSGLRRVIDAFGAEILTSDGELDRKKLAAIIFADEAKRGELNSIIHPIVIEEQDAWLAQCENNDPQGIAIIDAALMIESGGYRRLDKLIVVVCEPALQLRRLIERDALTPDAARSRIAAQMPQDEKRRYADFVIDTSGTLESTRSQTLAVADALRSINSE